MLFIIYYLMKVYGAVCVHLYVTTFLVLCCVLDVSGPQSSAIDSVQGLRLGL